MTPDQINTVITFSGIGVMGLIGFIIWMWIKNVQMENDYDDYD